MSRSHSPLRLLARFAVPALLALGTLAPAAAAQGVGTKLTEVKLADFAQTKAKDFEDFAGRAVMFEFFAYWCGPCGAVVPHVNEINETWGPKGLSVIGVTHESARDTEPWIARHGPEYAYAYDKGSKLTSRLGVNSWPRAVILDANGTVIYNGHPQLVTDELLERAVAGALPMPLWEWSGAAKSVRSAMQKRSYRAALAAATELGEQDGGPKILAAVQSVIQGKVSAMEGALKNGDFLEASRSSEMLQKDLAGLPEHEKAVQIAEKIAGDDAAQKVIKGQLKLAKLLEREVSSKKDVANLTEELKKLKAEYAGSIVDKQIGSILLELKRNSEPE